MKKRAAARETLFFVGVIRHSMNDVPVMTSHSRDAVVDALDELTKDEAQAMTVAACKRFGDETPTTPLSIWIYEFEASGEPRDAAMLRGFLP